MANAVPGSVTFLRKVAARTVLGDTPPKDLKEAVRLYTVYGVAESLKHGESTYGPWVALVGDFEAVRLSDREVFRGPVCFLPEPFMSIIVKAVQASLTKSEKQEIQEAVQFACIIGAKPAKTSTGYEYTCEPLIETKSSDRLQQLRNLTAAQIPALPAAKKTG